MIPLKSSVMSEYSGGDTIGPVTVQYSGLG
jgi:hypothetical protein